MIHSDYSIAILDAIFGNTIKPDETKVDEEYTQLLEDYGDKIQHWDVPDYVDDTVESYIGVKPQTYYNLKEKKATQEQQEENKKSLDIYERIKERINGSKYHTTQIYTDYVKTDNNITVPYDGWILIAKSTTHISYPQVAYLALFTQMPDEYGDNYIEPSLESTTYQRVNLYDAYFGDDEETNLHTLASVATDETTGAAYITNKELILFPEIENEDWGDIIGFGIFPVSDSGTPYIWGRLSNAPVSATVDHLPLFRKGNFKITIS